MRAALSISCALLLSITSGVAHAFCRSTTCSNDDCPRDAQNCKTTGHDLFWPTSCVGFSIQKDGTANLSMSAVRKVIVDSFFTWSDLACNGGDATMTFGELAEASCHQAQYNPSGPNANVVMFQDDKWTYTDINNSLAKTTVSYDTTSGEIWDADIELNFAYNKITVGDDDVAIDLQSILTHEIGHFIGLDHSLDSEATMNADYMMGTTFERTLAPDDVAGACAAYPATRSARCTITPKGGFVSACTGEAMSAESGSSDAGGGCSISDIGAADGASAAAILAALLGLAALRMRRRKRLIGATAIAIGSAALIGACAGDDPPNQTLCDAGSVIFCKCPDGEDGSKTCSTDGKSFSACTLQSTGMACPAHMMTPCQPGTVAFCTCRDGEQGQKTCDQDGQDFGECRLQTTGDLCPDHPSTSSSGGGGSSMGGGGAGGSGGSGGNAGGAGGGALGACPGVAAGVSAGNDTTVVGDTGQGVDREHDRCGGNGAPDLAYQVTPASSGTLIVTASGIGQTNPVLYARTGDCETGVSLGCSDATAGGGTEVLTLEAVAGTPVWVFVDGASGTSGSFSLNFHLTGGVPGDTCSGVPIAIDSGETITAGGDTSIATANYKGTGICGLSGTKEIVYAVTPSSDGSLTVKLSPEFDAQLYARSGSCTSSTTGTQLGCSDNAGQGVPETITFAVTAATPYYVFADGAAGESGPYTISFKLQ